MKHKGLLLYMGKINLLSSKQTLHKSGQTEWAKQNLTESLRLGPVTIDALAIFICLMPFLYDLWLNKKVWVEILVKAVGCLNIY